MSESKERSVFISYSHHDAPLARELSRARTDAGVRPWLDEEIRPGEEWEERLEEALRNARVIVVLLTPSSIRSPMTFFEIGAAVADQKIIVPVLSDGVNPKDIPAILRHFPWVKASPPDEAGAALVRAIKSATTAIATPHH